MMKMKISGGRNLYPQKRSMNLYVKERSVNSPSTVITTAVILAIFIALFTRIGVLDRLDKVRQLRQSVNDEKQELALLEEQLTDFDEVKEKYQRYTDHYLSDEELELVDRGEIISIVEKNVMSIGTCPSITIRGNSVSLVVQVSSLDEVATVREKLEACGKVRDVIVYTANWSESNVYVSYGEVLEDEAPKSFVQANICFTALTEKEAEK